MFKKYFDEKQNKKNSLLKAFKKGYEKAEQKKNEQIRALKIKHSQIIRSKDNKILNLEKRVQNIERSLNQHSDLVCITNSVIKKIKNNSYANTMLVTEDHKRIESMNDEVEMLEIRLNKSLNKTNDKILEFKRVIND